MDEGQRASRDSATGVSQAPPSALKHEIGAGTLWVFVSCSQEPRHLHDIIYAISILGRKGVTSERILIFVDQRSAELHFSPYGIGRIFPVQAFAAVLAAQDAHDNVMVVVGGHGDIVGLKAPAAPWSPMAFIAAVRSVPGISLGVVLLTQCYAGVFNFMDTRESPPLVVIGATNLNPSVSLGLRRPTPIALLDQSPGLQEWNANLFAFEFFAWLDSPTDVDGDGVVNLIDAYKFAGARANNLLRGAKARLFGEVQGQVDRLKSVQSANLAPVPKKLLVDAITTNLNRALDMLYLHQEPWILNAHLARDVRFA